jgi:hypothetical protein
MLQSLFYLTIALHVSGIITHLQEHKTTVTTAPGNRYTVIELHFYCYRVPIDKIEITVVVDNVYSAENAVCSIE